MTVQELIAELQKYPGHKVVLAYGIPDKYGEVIGPDDAEQVLSVVNLGQFVALEIE